MNKIQKTVTAISIILVISLMLLPGIFLRGGDRKLPERKRNSQGRKLNLEWK